MINEEKRTRQWRITATISLIATVAVLAFFVIRIMTNNPIRGIWTSTDSELTISISSLGNVTLSWPESDRLSDITVKMDTKLDRDRKIIGLSIESEALEKVASEAQDAASLRADISMLSGTFVYRVEDQVLTLKDPQSGDEIIFEKESHDH